MEVKEKLKELEEALLKQEERINILEQRTKQPSNDFIPVKQAAPILGLSYERLYLKIQNALVDPQNSPYKKGESFLVKEMGSRYKYLINPEKWQEQSYV